MELGERLRQERIAQGLSQRQLAGEKITRNMLSQIENGSATPSVDTLCYLAQQLHKPVSFFLEGGSSLPGFEKSGRPFGRGMPSRPSISWMPCRRKPTAGNMIFCVRWRF